MPAYNGERWIGRAIESILGQTYPALELVVSDNASTDGTRDICRAFASRDSRVRYFRNNENVGMNRNYNLAFQRARGEYFKWASCSDLCAPTLLEDCVNELESDSELVLCYGRTRLLRGDANDSESDPYDDGLDVSQDDPCDRMAHVLHDIKLNNVMNGVIRRGVLEGTSLVRDYFSSDIALVAELALHGKFRQVPKDLFFRRMTAETATTLKSRETFLEYYDAGGRGERHFQRWQLHFSLLRAAWRAPLGRQQRVRVMRYLLRNAAWDRKRLLREVSIGFRATMGSVRRITH